MDGREFITNAVRDAIVIDAIRNAEIALALTNGCAVSSAGVKGILHFDRQLARLQTALFLLGASCDAPAPLLAPAREEPDPE